MLRYSVARVAVMAERYTDTPRRFCCASRQRYYRCAMPPRADFTDFVRAVAGDESSHMSPSRWRGDVTGDARMRDRYSDMPARFCRAFTMRHFRIHYVSFDAASRRYAHVLARCWLCLLRRPPHLPTPPIHRPRPPFTPTTSALFADYDAHVTIHH